MTAIHPFADDNRRTARIVASLVMYRGGLRHPQFTSLEEWWLKTIKRGKLPLETGIWPRPRVVYRRAYCRENPYLT